MAKLKDYQLRLIANAMEKQVLCFGSFTLKSGRQSPYFFNAGKFNTGLSIGEVGQCYAQCILDHDLKFDVLFGPAYKGIPLVTSTAIALAKLTGKPVPFSFDRKEAKQHGEGGLIVGAPLEGKILILDDVISKGSAIRHSLKVIADHGAKAAGAVVAIDRQERGEGRLSAVGEVAEEFQIPVTSIVNLETVIEFVKNDPELQQHKDALAAYQAEYGV